MQGTVSPTVAEIGDGDVVNCVDDSLVEQIWRELGGKVSRERIHEIAMEAAAEFRSATITSFVPIFVRRRTRARLEMLIGEEDGR